jgi:hypothetical protein
MHRQDAINSSIFNSLQPEKRKKYPPPIFARVLNEFEPLPKVKRKKNGPASNGKLGRLL